MRLPLALCAWVLPLAVPGVHGLRPRDPAKLIASPQAVIWRSDRDVATRASPRADCPTGQPNPVEGSKIATSTTWSQSTDLVESIIMNYFRVSNSTLGCRVGRREGRPADPTFNISTSSASPRLSIFQCMRQSTDPIECIRMMPMPTDPDDDSEPSFIAVVAADAAANLIDAMRLLWGALAYFWIVKFVCRYVLPLYGTWRKFRLLERQVYELGQDQRNRMFHPASQARRYFILQLGSGIAYKLIGKSMTMLFLIGVCRGMTNDLPDAPVDLPRPHESRLGHIMMSRRRRYRPGERADDLGQTSRGRRWRRRRPSSDL